MKKFLIGLMFMGLATPTMATQICLPVNRDIACSYPINSDTNEATAPLAWQSDWGVMCSGVLFNGVSYCGTDMGKNSGDIIDSPWGSSDLYSLKACYCKFVQPVVSRWVYVQTYDTAQNCSQWCQNACAGTLLDQNATAFRNGMFSELFE